MKQERAERIVVPISNIPDGFKVQRNRYVLLNLIGHEQEENKN